MIALRTFKRESNKADGGALRRIAFSLREQWNSECFETGEDLAVTLHKDFPALDEVVLVERDVGYDWDRHERGRVQRRSNPKKTVITFCPPNKDPRPEDQTANEIKAKYAQEKWACPKMDHMDYKRSRPYNPDRPVKPSEDASDKA